MVEMKSGRGRKTVVLASIEDKTSALKQGTSSGAQTCSTLEIVQSLDMSMNTVHKILHNILHSCPHKIANVQKMLPIDLSVTYTFILEFFA